MNDNYVTVDIETVPREDVDSEAVQYLLDRAEKRDMDDPMLATQLGMAKIVAIGAERNESWPNAMVVAPGWKGTEHVRAYADEASMLGDFWRSLGKARLVTFNGRGFDGPMLALRSAMLGVRPTRNLVGYRFDIGDHCDLADVLLWQGSVRDRYSLDYWCRVLGVESPKKGMGGSMVAEAYEAKRYEDIGEYVRGDAHSTGEVYRMLRDGGLLATFKGGPQPAT